MRIMLDANIIISAGLFPDSIVGKVLAHVVKNHELVLCQYTLDELQTVFKKKFPAKIASLNKFLKELKYELVDAKIADYEKYPKVRDPDDIPLLAYAIESKVEMLLSGDKDFEGTDVGSPRIVTPREYLERYSE